METEIDHYRGEIKIESQFVNVVWIKEGMPRQKPIRITEASKIFERFDITTVQFWDAVMNARMGAIEQHEHLLINVDTHLIEMEGYSLRYDWYAIKYKITKLKMARWQVVQIDPEVNAEYPWINQVPQIPRREEQEEVGKGWHEENKRHAVTSKVTNIRKKYQKYNEQLDGEE